MSHGKDCNCPICSIGKKMGMIKSEDKQTDNSHGDQKSNDGKHHDKEGHKCDHC